MYEELARLLLPLILSIFLGFITVTILDKKWFEIDHKRIEKGFEIIEHYHFGIALIGAGICTIVYSPIIAFFSIGAGMGLIYHEAEQDDYFAVQSSHFKSSSMIGVVLTGIVVGFYFL